MLASFSFCQLVVIVRVMVSLGNFATHVQHDLGLLIFATIQFCESIRPQAHLRMDRGKSNASGIVCSVFNREEKVPLSEREVLGEVVPMSKRFVGGPIGWISGNCAEVALERKIIGNGFAVDHLGNVT